MALAKDCLLCLCVLAFTCSPCVVGDNSTDISTSTTEIIYSSTEKAVSPSTGEAISPPSAVENDSKATKHPILLNETLREIEEEIDDSGKIAGIIIGVLGAICIILTIIGFCIYKQYLRRNITSMNFDNPVYRKTTEDQFSLEKNQYQPARSYPSSLEPLTSPGTNEFV